MSWEPTTRGVGGKKTPCGFHGCKLKNDNTAFCTTDFIDTRYYCEEHWEEISAFFALVEACNFCYRAHRADLFRSERGIDTVKYRNKWWELCRRHRNVYDDSVDVILPSDFFD